MLNMKKGLAIVLAAATALTFAPVSTLGLTGVVQAQAAEVTTLANWTTAGSANYADDAQTITVDSTKTGAAQTFKLHIKNDDVTNDFTNLVVTGAPNGVTDDAAKSKTLAKSTEADITFTVANNATVAASTPITVTSTVNGQSYTYKFNLVINHATADAAAAEKAAQEGSATFGGVKTAIIATDNTTYSLVNSNVSFDYKGVNYTADQLKWYLTKTPSTTPVNMGFTQGSAVITESGADGTGKLAVKVANAKQFEKDTDGASIVGVYTSGAVNKIVYSKAITVTGADAGVITNTYDAGTIATDLTGVSKNPLSKDFLDGIQFIGTNNKKLNGSNSTVETASVTAGNNFTATLTDYAKDDGNAAKTSTVALAAGKTISNNGVYYETYYVPYTDTTEGSGVKFIAEINLTVSVNAGPSIEVKDGNFVYSDASSTPVDSKVIDLDLSTNKTFDLASHIYSSKDNTTYSYDVDTLNVTVSDKGVVTASKVGTAVVKITPKANGVSGTPVYVFFRVNQNANDQISVAGKDGDKATVLTTRQYNGNSVNLTTEAKLAAAQVGYVQVEVTGDETVDVKEALTVKGAGNLSYALAAPAAHGESIDPKTGAVTIPHSYLNTASKNNPATLSYVFPVKVVSTETKTSALTTGYFYIVVDYADATVNGLQSSYDLGTSGTATDSDSWLNLGLNDNFGPVHVSSNTSLTSRPLTKNDALDNSKIYTDDNSDAFVNNLGNNNVVERATVSGKTEHILVTAGNASQKIGNTYKVVTVKSVPGQSNYVTKIVNVATGKTIYETNAVTSGASIVIDKTTVVKVTVAHAPSASLNPKYDPAFTIGNGENDFNYNTLNYFVAATENPKTYEVTLIPSQEGTQIVSINPTEGRLSETDYSLVGSESLKLAVKYAAAQTPGQVKNVKVKNAKGAKVTVTFSKENTNKNMKYYVQKKIGKKTAGKSVASTKASLSVKKGKTIKVRVKAYYYDANGVKHVGKYSSWKTLKTDKK